MEVASNGTCKGAKLLNGTINIPTGAIAERSAHIANSEGRWRFYIVPLFALKSILRPLPVTDHIVRIFVPFQHDWRSYFRPY